MRRESLEGVELQDPTNPISINKPKLSFAAIAKLKMKAAEISLDARVNAAIKEESYPPTSPTFSQYSNNNNNNNQSNHHKSTTRAISKSLTKLAKSINLVVLPLLLMSFFVAIILLYLAKSVLVPFVIAIFLTYLLRPVVNLLLTPYSKCSRLVCTSLTFSTSTPYQTNGNNNNEEEEEELGLLTLERRNSRSLRSLRSSTSNKHNEFEDEKMTDCTKRLPRPVAVLIVMLLTVCILGGGVLLVTDAVQGFGARDLLLYEESGSLLLNNTLKWVKLSFDVDGTYLQERVSAQVGVIDIVRAIVMFCVDATVNIFWVMLFVMYLLYESESKGRKPFSIRAKIDKQITKYLTIKALISLMVGGAVWLWLVILGVRMAHLFALFTFVLNFIPNAGPLVATFLPLPVVVLDPLLGYGAKIFAFIGPIIIHGIVGNVVEPSIFGHSLELHPVTVLLALAFWYLVWGSAGAILSVPITASLRIILLSNKDSTYCQSCLMLLDGRLFEAFGSKEEEEEEEEGGEEDKKNDAKENVNNTMA